MRVRAIVACLPLFLACVTPAAAADLLRPPYIVVGPIVQVTGAMKSRFHWESTICADSRNSRELAVGAMYLWTGDNYSQGVAFYTSHDAGMTWRLAIDAGNGEDPTCAYGPDGELYAAMMFNRGRGLANGGIVLFRSRNHGKTWTSTRSVTPPTRFFDRPWLTVDTNTKARRGELYFNAIELATEGAPDEATAKSHIIVFRSSDREESLEESEPIAASNSQMGQIATLSDGTVVFAYATTELKGGKLIVASSGDGGGTFHLQTFADIGTTEVNINHLPYIHNIPMLAVDRSNGPFRDRIYMVWSASQSGRDQVWFACSLDRRGQLWARPRIIDDSLPFNSQNIAMGPSSANPAIAVNNSGVVGISWADRRDNRRGGYTPRFMASLDGGTTWSRSEAIESRIAGLSSGSQLQRWEASDVNGIGSLVNGPLMMILPGGFDPFWEPGDHWGMTADADGIFHPVWLDDRTGAEQDWTSSITVRGSIHVATNVTDGIRIGFGAQGYDARTKRGYVDVVATNISHRLITLPLILKSLDAGEFVSYNVPPRVSDLVFTNAFNGWPAAGAYWVLEGSRNETALAPGSTLTTRIRFKAATLKNGASIGVAVYSVR